VVGGNKGVTVMERDMGVRGLLSRWDCLGIVFAGTILSFVCPVFVLGQVNPNHPPSNPLPPSPSGFQLGFDPNDYSFLVYDCGVNPGAGAIQGAMRGLGISSFAVRNSENPVTVNDLDAPNKILIVGWNSDSSMSGLNPAVLAAGIRGRILLTGHDADLHTTDLPAAKQFLGQAIGWVLASSGTGLVAMGDFAQGFSWLPPEWGVSATGGLIEEMIYSFTEAGLASGVYAGLDPNDMQSWGNSYHDRFTALGVGF
jgi:hypothetical protein